jgi:hypothetical protein
VLSGVCVFGGWLELQQWTGTEGLVGVVGRGLEAGEVPQTLGKYL